MPALSATYRPGKCAKIDRRTTGEQDMTGHDSLTYLAWSNALAQTLAKIGLKAGVAAT